VTDPDLNESAWQRAIASARRVYPSTEFEVAAALMTIIAGSIAAVASAGADTTIQIAIPILGGAVALLMTFAVVLAFQLVAAPIRQRNELRRAWGPAEPVKPINIELTLRNERRKASGFYRVNRRGTVVRTKEDEQGAEEWTNRVVGLLSEHVDADAAREFIEAPKDADGFKARLDAQAAALDHIIEGLTENR
jgi:hypothetical protein